MTQRTNAKSSLFTSIVALFLCVAMFTGTTFAWFTDSVTSSGNIIQTGTLRIQMNWAEGKEDPANATWEDASEGAIFNYDKWEPGYTDAKHIQIKNVGTLALNYQLRIVAEGTVSELADVIDVYYFKTATAVADRTAIENAVDVENADDTATVIKLGTLADILGAGDAEKNIAKTVKGTLYAEGSKAEDGSELPASTEITLVLKMQEDAGNEYQDKSIGSGFSVELIATQATYEADSFDDQYDAGVPSPEVPAALVRPLEELDINATLGIGGDEKALTLATGYKFEPTETLEEAKVSAHRYWHADFFVYADKDVPADSIALAGYYDAWCSSLNGDKWVALVNENFSVPAGEENGIRLVEGMGGGQITVNYEELCQYGNDGIGFQCGLAGLDAEALAGTTITVELRLYETTKAWDADSGTANEETGEYITIGTFEYTFPGEEVSTADELVEALGKGDSVTFTDDIKIDPANMSNAYGTTGINVKNGQTIDGNGHILDIKGAGGTWDSGINTTGGIIKNLTVTGSFRGVFINHNSTYSEPVVLKNVTIDGTTYTISCDQGLNQTLKATDSTFNGWTSYAATLGSAEFIGCTFGEGNGYAYCRPYCETTFTNCTFEEGYTVDPRANIVFENCYIGETLITAENVSDLVTDTAKVTVK